MKERDRQGRGEGVSPDLVDRFRLGPDSLDDPKAFAAIYRDLYPSLHAHAMSLVGSPERADDAIQSAFMSTIGALKEGTRIDDVERWLHRCVRNACMNELRRDRRLSYDALHALPAADDPVELAHWRSRCRQMYGAVDEMPEHVRTALLLSEVRGLSYREIAAEMKRSVESVRALIFRARSDLRATVGTKLKALLAPFAPVAELLERTARVVAGPLLPVAAVAALAFVAAQPPAPSPAGPGPSSESSRPAQVALHLEGAGASTEQRAGDQPGSARFQDGRAESGSPAPARPRSDERGSGPPGEGNRSGGSSGDAAPGGDGAGDADASHVVEGYFDPGDDHTPPVPPPVEAPRPPDPPPPPPVEAPAPPDSSYSTNYVEYPAPDPGGNPQGGGDPDTEAQPAPALPQGEPVTPAADEDGEPAPAVAAISAEPARPPLPLGRPVPDRRSRQTP